MRYLTSESAWQAFRADVLIRSDDARFLKDEADKNLVAGTISLTTKKTPAPSGDLRDYMSQAPYWWPDPAKPDGLPYVRRDGEVNPEFYGTDRDTMTEFRNRLSALILQGWVVDDQDYSRSAGRLLRTWFLGEKTRMNPNLRYAQRIPGRCDGRGIGIIDTACLCFLLDDIGRLPFNEDWTREDLTALKSWFSAYLDWLLTSDHGREEGGEHNNHGTWYDAQVVCFAVFCGREEDARHQIEQHTLRRIGEQIAADGSQPHELARTLSYSYCTFNLLGVACLAQVGAGLGFDLWKWRSADTGASLQEAVKWMLPYYLGERPWAWPQIGPFVSALRSCY